MENFDTYYNFGIQSEMEIVHILKQYFNETVTKSTYRYAKHDFYDHFDNRYELRTRQFHKDKYATTAIAYDKLDCKLQNTIKGDLYLMFRFTDGLFYIKYDRDEFEPFVVKNFSRSTPRLKDGKVFTDKSRPHIFIPVNKLIKIDK